MPVALFILLTVLATAILSGIIGMAGGIVLMGVLVSVLSVATAMVVHGAVQAASNGARWFFLRKHTVWKIVPAYAIGATVVVSGFAVATLVPDPAVILIVIGIFPWLARLTPRLGGLDVTHPVTAGICGVVVTAAQLFAGASGPLLDVFYLNTSLDRYQIIASKAFTQTVGHLIKLTYYGIIIGVAGTGLDAEAPVWLIAAGMVTAVLGARIGTKLLRYVDDQQFRRVSGWVILALGAVCVAKGSFDLAGVQ